MPDRHHPSSQLPRRPDASFSPAIRSASLAKRGLDLVRTLDWDYRQVVPEEVFFAKVSANGQVCRGLDGPSREHHIIEVRDLCDEKKPAISIVAPAQWEYCDEAGTWRRTREGHVAEAAVSVAWSPCGRYLVSGSGNHERALRLFDIARRAFVEVLGSHKDDLYHLAWSPDGRYLASASTGYDPRLRLWRCDWDPTSTLFGPTLRRITALCELTELDEHPQQWLDKQSHSWRGLGGFTAMAFRPNGSDLAAVAILRDAPDLLVVLRLPDLIEHCRIVASSKSHIRDLCWSRAGDQLLFTCDGRVFTAEVKSFAHVQPEQTGVYADLCAVHLRADLVAFAQGRYEGGAYVGGLVEIREWPSLSAVSHYVCPSGVCDLSWSADGTALWALCKLGGVAEYRNRPSGSTAPPRA